MLTALGLRQRSGAASGAGGVTRPSACERLPARAPGCSAGSPAHLEPVARADREVLALDDDELIAAVGGGGAAALAR